MTTTRIRGAHRRSSVAAATPDPARVGGPSRWTVSLGVLAVVAAICAVGAYALDGGGGRSPVAAPGASASPSAWSASTLAPGASPGASSAAPSAIASASASVSASASPSASASASPSASAAPSTAAAEQVPAADRRAGIATRTLVEKGSGRLLVVPGQVPAPTAAPRMTVRVEVEEGMGADGAAFASFVMDTLNDPRGWAHGRALSFARTDGQADFTVVLASPDTSATLCAPERTGGTLSCGGGTRAVLTMYRWMKAAPQWSDDLTAYRHYALNHEVGHVLGRANTYCDPGHTAPVMVDQTKGLYGCLRNAWPYPQA